MTACHIPSFGVVRWKFVYSLRWAVLIGFLRRSLYCTVVFFSLRSVVSIVFSCNRLRLLVFFFLLLFVWYSTPRNFWFVLRTTVFWIFLLVLVFLVFRYLYLVWGSDYFLLEGAVIRHQCLCGPVFLRIYCSSRSRLRLI